jgi:hypothetical protein
VLLVGVGAPGEVELRDDAGAPRAWSLFESSRAEVEGCAEREVGGYGSLPLASLRGSAPQPPGLLAFVFAWLSVLGGRSLCCSLGSLMLVGRSSMELREIDLDHA